MRFDGDYLRHYPFRYENRKDYQTGQVVSAKNIYTRNGKTVQKIRLKIPAGIKELTYFNQPYLVKTLKPGVNLSIAGNEYEINGPLIHTGRLVPIYPETKGITSKMIRRRVYNLLKTAKINDWLPEKLKRRFRLMDLVTALKAIHFPEDEAAAETARRRLAFDELLEMQLIARAKKAAWKKKTGGVKITANRKKLNQVIMALPFKLTASQNRTLKEIMADISTNQPMNRLLQGEVGSGKTVVAALVMYLAFLNGRVSILMAPTEILARQHYQTIKRLLAKTPATIGLVTKDVKETGQILVGTHALLNQKYSGLGLVVIDEQHRFGVNQRSRLLNLKPRPHLLSMTATPIPRTLALTLYAHLDLSALEPIPGQTNQVKTWIVPEAKRGRAYDWIKQQIKQRQTQVFIVCPLINQSEKESMQDIKAVEAEYSKLNQVFSGFSLALIHGRQKTGEKNQTIAAFAANKLNLLVATPVIEVGIDIPGAGIIVIENAERFGMSQLHQLRGRVGRRGQPAYCLLFTENQGSRRLKIMETTYSGIKLAEADLKLRGEGKIFGLDQHGLSQFKLADLSDLELIKQSRQAATIPDLKLKAISAKIALIQPN